MKLKITVPEKIILERDVDSVTLPGAAGQLTAMMGHDIFVTSLVPGSLFFRYSDSEGKQYREDYEIGSGFAEITKDTARVFAKSAVKT